MVLLLASVALLAHPISHEASTMRENIRFGAVERSSSGSAGAPLEEQSTESLRRARQNAASGEADHARATLDSLVMSDGVSIAIEGESDQSLWAARGVEAWNEALADRPFRIKGAGEANVTIRFVHSLDGVQGGDTQGRIEATRKTSWGGSAHCHRYHLNGVVYVRDNVAGRPIQPDEIVNVVAHECGHLLGLADTTRTDRLMGPLVVGKTHDAPAPEETRAIQEYRDQVRQSYPKG